MSRYRPGKSARKMYRHKDRYGTAGMSKRQLRALAREMDIGVNPRGRKSRRNRITKYAGKAPSNQRIKSRSYRKGRRGLKPSRYYRGNRNPYKGRYYKGRKSTRSAWNPVLTNPKGHTRRDHRGFKDGGARRRKKVWAKVLRSRDNHARFYAERRRNPLHHDVAENMIGMALGNPRRARRNPKRDGSMTKGEARLQKHAEWLRLIADRGRKATAMLKSMHTVPVASHAAIHEHAEEKVSATVIAKALDGVPAAVEKVADVVEHAEAKFLRQQITDLTMLINSTKEEAESLGEQDEGMAEELMEQVTKMSKQRATLKAKAEGLGIRTNPRPRSARRTVLVGLHRYAKALADLRAALRHRPSNRNR